jgi:hypothetical protein
MHQLTGKQTDIGQWLTYPVLVGSRKKAVLRAITLGDVNYYSLSDYTQGSTAYH